MHNLHLYSLRAIRKLLELVDSFIPYVERPGLFREPGDDTALTALKSIIGEMKWHHDPAKNAIALNMAIDSYNKQVRVEQKKPLMFPIASDSELKKGKKEKEPMLAEVMFEEPPRNVNPIDSLVWASFYKYLIQNGQILDRASLQVNAAWHTLLHQLRNIQTIFAREDLTQSADGAPPLLKLNEETVRSVFLCFIGQLCMIGHEESASVIHNYIHMATKAFAGQRANGMTQESAGSMILNVLLAGLDLAGALVLPSEDSETALYEASAAEHRFFPKLTPILISAPQFQQPFDRKLYEAHQQNKALYDATLAAAIKLMWRDVPKLNAPLCEVIFQSPREDTKPLTKEPAALLGHSSEELLVENKGPEQDKKEKKPSTLLALLQKLSLSDRKLPTPLSPKESPPRIPKRASQGADSPIRDKSGSAGSPRPVILGRTPSAPRNLRTQVAMMATSLEDDPGTEEQPAGRDTPRYSGRAKP